MILEKEVPERMTPRPYQEEDIEVAVKGVEFASFLAHEMGVGKTLIAVEALLRRGDERILIIAPLNTHRSWEKTILAQSQGTARVMVHPPGTCNSVEANRWWLAVAERQPGWYILGWEAFRGKPTEKQQREYKALCEEYKRLGRKKKPTKGVNLDWSLTGRWDAAVVDECQRMSNRKAMTFYTAVTINAGYKMALSGTPARNKVEGYWSNLFWLWPHRYGADEPSKGYWKWVSQFCQTETIPRIGKRILGEKFPGAATSRIPCYLRRTTEEVNKDLPEVIERVVEVPLLEGAQAKAYREMERRAFTWLENKPLGARLPVIQDLRLRQIALGVPRAKIHPTKVDEDGHPKVDVDFSLNCKSNKIDMVKEILDDLPNGDEPVVIYTHSAKFARVVAHQLDKKYGPAVAFVEGISAHQQRTLLDTFGQEGGPRILVAGIAKIAEGTDGLQHVCHHEIWLSRENDNVLNNQAERRLHRPGQKYPVQRWILNSTGTADDTVYARTEENSERMRQAYAKR